MRTRVILALATLIIALGACSEPDRPSIPLYLAIQRGDIDQLERHIHWGTDLNTMLPDGRYPLHTAAEKGRFIMVRTLLRNGADIAAQTEQGDSALDLAILSGRTQVAELLLDSGARLDASALMLKAAELGVTDRDTVKFLVDAGADLQQRDANGDTPLLIAIRQDNHRLATHLVARGADVNVKTADGRSALALAGQLGYPELISLLQRQGAR